MLCYSAGTETVVRLCVPAHPAARQEQWRTGEASKKLAQDESGSHQHIQAQRNELTHSLLDAGFQAGQSTFFSSGVVMLRNHSSSGLLSSLSCLSLPAGILVFPRAMYC